MPTNESAPVIDEAKAEAFAGKMVDTINGAAVALMTSIGHRTALFDTMAEIGVRSGFMPRTDAASATSRVVTTPVRSPFSSTTGR